MDASPPAAPDVHDAHHVPTSPSDSPSRQPRQPRRPQLVAPAGSLAALRMALQHGADAIVMGAGLPLDLPELTANHPKVA